MAARLVDHDGVTHLDHHRAFVLDCAEGLGTAAGRGSQRALGPLVAGRVGLHVQEGKRIAFKLNGANLFIKRGGQQSARNLTARQLVAAARRGTPARVSLGVAFQAMRCPHCGVTIVWSGLQRFEVGRDEDGTWQSEAKCCEACNKVIIQLVRPNRQDEETIRLQAWPRTSNRLPCPPEVPEAICRDYLEACLVLADSPKASAALSRRVVQEILRDPRAGNVKAGDLAHEIDQVIDSGQLPSGIIKSLDVVRSIGNFAAHPTKSTNSGEVLEVEPGEAEWNLDIIEALMDVYYVQPAVLEAKRAALNAKLAEAGKPPV